MILSPCHVHSCHLLAEVCLGCLGCMAGSHYSLLEPISADGHYERLKWLCWVKDGEGTKRQEMGVTKSHEPVQSHLNAGPTGDNCLELLPQGMKYLHLQGSTTGSNFSLCPKNKLWFKLEENAAFYVSKLHQQCVAGAKMSLPCTSQSL